MSDNCLHPYDETFHANVDMLHNNIPQDRKTVRICKKCKRVIDIENKRSTIFESPTPTLGCDHPYNSVFKKELRIVLTKNKDVEIVKPEVKICKKCDRYIENISIDLSQHKIQIKD